MNSPLTAMLAEDCSHSSTGGVGLHNEGSVEVRGMKDGSCGEQNLSFLESEISSLISG